MREIVVYNMTNFFNRELFLYALGDIKFKKPVSLKKAAYTLGFLLVWTLPMFLLFGLKFTPLYIAFLLGPPLLLAHFATKQIWGGRSLIDFLRTVFGYIGEHKLYTDLRATKKDEKFFVESEIWISRRREMAIIADMQDKGISSFDQYLVETSRKKRMKK